MNCETHQATEFLKLLDPSTNKFTFQTLGEGKKLGKKHLTKLLHGTFDEHHDKLLELNAQGAGVFVTINKTDGKGRKAENIVGVRALWQEDDNEWEGDFPLPPSLVVESSPSKFHRYWLLQQDEPCDEEMKELFKGLMRTMVTHFGSDPNAKDISRVLRLPGFLHRKATPKLVKIIENDGTRYSFADILTHFPEPQFPSKEHELVETKCVYFHPDELRSALRFLPAENRDDWFRYGAAIYDEFGGNEDGFEIWDEWSRTTSAENYDEVEQRHYWHEEFCSRKNGRRATIATIHHNASAAGWQENIAPNDLNRMPTIDLTPFIKEPAGELTEKTIESVQQQFNRCDVAPMN